MIVNARYRHAYRPGTSVFVPEKKEKRERVPENPVLCFLSREYPIDVFICRTFVSFDVVRLFFLYYIYTLCLCGIEHIFNIDIHFLNKSSDLKIERDDTVRIVPH